MRVWKKVPGVACLASNDGKIKHLNSPIKRIQEEDERPQYYSQCHRYKIVRIYSKSYYVHRLVAAAFHGACPTGLVVDHIDGNSINNNAENLRYITSCENVSRARINKPTKFSDQQIREIKEMVKRRKSLGLLKKDIAKIFNITNQTLKRYCRSL